MGQRRRPQGGLAAIREYFGHGLERYPDLVLEPTGEFWARPDGLALQWEMGATVIDDSMGDGHLGKKWSVPGLSFLVFDGLQGRGGVRLPRQGRPPALARVLADPPPLPS